MPIRSYAAVGGLTRSGSVILKKGYWSLVGQDSIIYAPQTEQSLNLALFDVAPPDDREIQRVVLHEFGHALGFQHEHQHPTSGCEAEFAWPQIYAYLGQSPNYWSKETVDFNMRSRPYHDGDVVTDFDPQSIMLYSFPADFYKNGTASRCFSGTNTALSAGDKATVRLAYGGAAGRPDAGQLASVTRALPADERDAVSSRVTFLNADLPTKAKRIGVGQKQYTDIDLYACSTAPSSLALLEQLSVAMADQPRIGRLYYAGLTTRAAVAEGISVVADIDHPEIADADRLVTALSARLGKVRRVANAGPSSRWKLDIIACGAR